MLVLIEHDRGHSGGDGLPGARPRSRPRRPARRSAPSRRSSSARGRRPRCRGRHRGAARTWAVTHPAVADYAPEAWGDALAQVAGAAGAERGRRRRHGPRQRGAGPRRRRRGPAVRGQRHRRHRHRHPRRRSVGADPDPLGREPARAVDPRGAGQAPHRVAPRLRRARARPPLRRRPPRSSRSPRPSATTPTAPASSSACRPRPGSSLVGAAVVVSGGRGVGSAEGFAVLEELAEPARRRGRLLPGRHQQRLAAPLRPGRPDRQADRARALHRLRHLRGHPALGRDDGGQAGAGHQHRQGCADGDQGRLRRASATSTPSSPRSSPSSGDEGQAPEPVQD